MTTSMAPSSSSSPASSSKSPPPPPPHSPHFTPIQECEREEPRAEHSGSTENGVTYKHHPTPLHHPGDKNGRPNSKKWQESDEEDVSISCNKCRPHPREKISVVPLDNGNNNGAVNKGSSFIASPNAIFKSIFHSLTRRSPRSKDISSAREEQWKIAFAELSHKLIQTTRKRDEALLEASRLKYSVAELERKLSKLEVYCHDLKSGLEECSSSSPYRIEKNFNIRQTRNHDFMVSNEKVIEQFLIYVSEARSAVRLLSRSLTMLLRHMGTKTYERISVLLQPYDIKISFSKNPKSALFYLEALLNKAFFEDFESVGFQRNATNHMLNPIDRCEANLASFHILKELTWEEVLGKGTRHFSEEFSRFCDRKMSEIVAMLLWNRAWPEPLLQAFFSASKNVWLVHLLANSVHPGLPLFRVDKGVRFDSVFMEDMNKDRAWKLVPTMVRIMVAPGFYVYGNVVKCKVLCRYNNNDGNKIISNSIDKGLIPSP